MSLGSRITWINWACGKSRGERVAAGGGPAQKCRLNFLSPDEIDDFRYHIPQNEASPQQAAGYQTEGHCRGDTTVSPPSSLCKVTSQQAPRNLLIENETFNTLKNQGYNFEHNYGHGTQNLSVVFAVVMMLAFLVDQTQQLCCALFRAVWAKMGSKRLLWERMRSLFYAYRLDSMRTLFEALFYGFEKHRPILTSDTS